MKYGFICLFLFNLNLVCPAGASNTVDLQGVSTVIRDGEEPFITADETLLTAAGQGSVNDIKQALKDGANLHAVDSDGDGVLHLAAWFNDSLRVFEFLLSKGADPNQTNSDGMSPLHIAVWADRPLAVVQFFIDNDADIHLKDEMGVTPLLASARSSYDIQIPLALLNAGANLHAVDEDGDGVLHLAIWFHDSPLQMILFLLFKGADPNQINSVGASPLLLAVEQNKPLSVIQALIENKADINLKDDIGATPLLASAVSSYDTQIPLALLNAGANLHAVDEDGDGVLHYFFETNNESLDLFMFFLEQGVDVQLQNNKGWSILHLAAAFTEYPEFITLLVERGLDINSQTSQGNLTPLHFSVVFNNTPGVTQRLLELGSNIYAVDNMGMTPLKLIDFIDNPDIVNLLLKHKEHLKEDL